MNIVISQSMFFPWVGLLEQIKLADIFVHYDDVQFSKGSFTNRVQIKTSSGMKWMTVPLERHQLGQSINKITYNSSIKWQQKHLDFLKQTYRIAPFCKEMIDLVEGVYNLPTTTLGDISKESMLALCDYFEISKSCKFYNSEEINVDGEGSQRVFDIVNSLNGKVYISGLGARNYLDFELFEVAGIEVKLMKYRCNQYQQLYGQFNPYVSSLDLIANCGRAGISVLNSHAKNWKEFTDESD